MTDLTRRAMAVTTFFADVRAEYHRVVERHGDPHSAHEGWALIFEEVDELWDEVRRKRANRDLGDMRTECVQIAARSTVFAIAICTRKKKET